MRAQVWVDKVIVVKLDSMSKRSCNTQSNSTGARRRHHEDCYDSSSPCSSGSSSPTHVPRRSTSVSSDRSRLGNGVRATRLLRPRVGSTGSGGGESPRSLTLDSQRLRSSPLRTSRQKHANLGVESTHNAPEGTSSPGEDLSDDSGIRLDRETYQDMFQDVINIKTMLYRLKRVFQNQETENAFDNTLPNGMYYNLGHDGATEDSSNQKKDADVADELTDLRRQVVFLQQQLKEKDRIVQNLQESITRLKEVREDKHNLEVTRETCNAATQTERVRPVSSGPSLLQGLPNDGSGGSLVSNTSKSKTHSTLKS